MTKTKKNRLCLRSSSKALLATSCLMIAGCGSGSDSASEPAEPAGEVIGQTEQSLAPPAAELPSTFARQWMTNLANSVKGDSISPVVAARTYAFGGIALYESVVHGMPGHQSLVGQLNGLNALPTPDPNLEYDWATVMAATMSVVGPGVYVFPFRLFFEFTTETQAALTSLGPQQIGFRRSAGVPEEVIGNSVEFGSALGGALVQWANSDGYLDVYRFKAFQPPEGPGTWEPTGFSDEARVANPLEPYWGEIRPLVLSHGSECQSVPPVEFSTEPGSDFYNQALAVYDAVINGTEEQRTIAEYWADNPGETSTPPGHWVEILNQYARDMNLADAARSYATLGIAMHDAGIAIWFTKFKHNLIRPSTYIRRHIDPHWQSHVVTPQFPEYTSGHSGFSGAAGKIMDYMFGEVPFTDSTKVRDGFGPRSFPNHFAAAEEAMDSRLYGGIHYPMANVNGGDTGVCVADKLVERVDFNE